MSPTPNSTPAPDAPASFLSSATDAPSHQGSLRSKLVLSLAAIFLVFLAIDDQVRRHVIESELASLERSDAILDANRVLAAMNAEIEHLCDLARHWAAWSNLKRSDESSTSADLALNSTRPLLESRNSRSIDATNSDPPWHQQQVDYVVRINRERQCEWLFCSSDASDLKVTAAPELIALAQACGDSNRGKLSGMTRVGASPLTMFAVIQLPDDAIGKQDHEYLVVARDADQATIATLNRQTQVEFSLQSPRSSDPNEKLVVWEASEDRLIVEIQLVGVHGDHLANVYIEVPREITVRAHRTLILARNSFVFGVVASLLALLLLLQRIVITPLATIRQHSGRVADEGLEIEPLDLSRNDEIGQLASAFDSMFSRLKTTQHQLSRASQAAGRSQVARTVIHNVGNVLTNVNSLLDSASGHVQGLRIDPLEKLAARLRNVHDEDGLLKATPDYLEGLAGSLKSDQQLLAELLSTLNENVRHIHDVIRAQQKYTDHRVEASPESLQSIIDEAIACCSARLDQDRVTVNIEIQRDVQVDTDRSLLLQTMINIIGNAGLSMRDVHGARKLDISVQEKTSSVQVVFQDSGCGMAEETLQRIFDAHFTTRESGTGLGLHFCANTLKRLGGSIQASSPGLGKGSTFVIDLPLHTSSSNSPEIRPLGNTHAGSSHDE